MRDHGCLSTHPQDGFTIQQLIALKESVEADRAAESDVPTPVFTFNSAQIMTSFKTRHLTRRLAAPTSAPGAEETLDSSPFDSQHLVPGVPPSERPGDIDKIRAIRLWIQRKERIKANQEKNHQSQHFVRAQAHTQGKLYKNDIAIMGVLKSLCLKWSNTRSAPLFVTLDAKTEETFSEEHQLLRQQLVNELNFSRNVFHFKPCLKPTSFKRDHKGYRGSTFIGVSRNGSGWQVIFKV